MVFLRLTALLHVLAALLLGPGAAHAAAPTPPERALYADGPAGRYLLERGWSSRADPDDMGLRQGWQRPGMSAGFRPVAVPNAFNTGDLTKRGFRSRVQWYRTRFTLPRAAAAGGWRLRFESVNRHADVWLNGRRLGSHDGAFLPFELQARSVHAGENELVVRVDGRLGSATDLPPGTRPRGWWNYGGILREVYLRRVGQLDVSGLQVTTSIGNPARVTVSATVRNASSRGAQVRYAVFLRPPDAADDLPAIGGRSAGSLGPGKTRRITGTFAVGNPQLWSPPSPALYRLALIVPGDNESVQFGIRQWSVDAQGHALLNGRPLQLRGTSFQEDTKKGGAALGPADRDRLVAHMQALGANLARTHYPPHPALLEAFDRLGIVYWDEVPVWRLTKRELASAKLRQNALRDLREMVLRDRNHAAVMAWSVSNETLKGGSSERRYIDSAAALTHRLDPSRFAAAATVLSPSSTIPDYYSKLDAIGLNGYLGWYGTSELAQLRPLLDAARTKFPRQALFLSEFGAESNRSGPDTEKGTYAFQSSFLGRTLDEIDRTDFLSGAILWVLRDYPLRPGWIGGNPRPDSPFNDKGVVTWAGTRKPAFDVVAGRFRAVPPLR